MSKGQRGHSKIYKRNKRKKQVIEEERKNVNEDSKMDDKLQDQSCCSAFCFLFIFTL